MRRPPTLTLSGEEHVAVVAGAGVAARRVDTDLGGVAVVGARLALVHVCRRGQRVVIAFPLAKKK